jgi:hypothetical protein
MDTYLNEKGQEILKMILDHCKDCALPVERLKLEASMLANSFAMYDECARYCNDYGISMSFAGKEKEGKAEAGIYQQIRPEYTVMKNEYANILKHSPKFGLNPMDFEKIFKGSNKPKKKQL